MLLIARHSATHLNEEQRYQGWTNAPLSDMGIDQAKALGATIKSKSIAPDLILSSDLTRAVQTVINAEFNSFHEQHQELRELNYGHFEGLTKGEAMHTFPDEFNLRENSKWTHPCPSGESLSILEQRIKKCNIFKVILEFISSDNCCLLIGHFNVNKVIWKNINNFTIESHKNFEQGHGDLFIYQGSEKKISLF